MSCCPVNKPPVFKLKGHALELARRIQVSHLRLHETIHAAEAAYLKAVKEAQDAAQAEYSELITPLAIAAGVDASVGWFLDTKYIEHGDAFLVGRDADAPQMQLQNLLHEFTGGDKL
jgi:hypothetical protein